MGKGKGSAPAAAAAASTQDDSMEDVVEMAATNENRHQLYEGLAQIDREHDGDEAASLKRELIDTYQVFAPRAAKAARVSA